MNGRDLLLSPELDKEKIAGFLAEFGFQDPEAADRGLQQIAGLSGDPFLFSGIVDSLLEAFRRSADPDSALRGMVSFAESLPSLTQFIQVAAENPSILEVACAITGGSEFLTLIMLRNPGYLYWLMEKGNLETCRDPEYFRREASRALRISSSPRSCLEALQRCQRREILRIGTQDLLHTLPMRDIAAQISRLADSMLQAVLELTAGEYGFPIRDFVVLGMGKLGGMELNFSSDVDLIFLHSDQVSRQETVRFSRAYRKALTESAPEGHFYRVDLRLRPMGGGGEIAASLKAADNYYRHWADTTDRLAMIKARPVAGNLELGEKFLDSLQGFIYKKYQDFAAVEEIRLLKRRTDRELRKKERIHSDIKLGLGGIREIEFFVQSFQLLYGGVIPRIRSGNTPDALDRLLDNGLIDGKDHRFLKESYTFLRDLEHKLQLVNYLQTQALPEENSELYFCARRMGYRNEETGAESGRTMLVASFQEDLSRITRGVNRIFSGLLQGEGPNSELSDILLDKSISDDDALQKIRKACSPRDPEGILEGVRILGNAQAFPHSPRKMRNLLANLLPFLLEKAAPLQEPRELFTRLDRFAEALGGRVILYSEMAANQAQAGIILDILASGPFLAESLIQRPELTDYLMSEPDPEPDYRRRLPESFEISALQGRSFEDSLRFFKHSEEFKLGVREVPAPGNPLTRRLLSELAEACLECTVDRLLDKYPAVRRIPFAIAALGKLGGSELIFHSDLDLLFVYDHPSSDREAVRELLAFVKAVKSALYEYTSYGRAYTLDFRLRPEGRSATDIISRDQLVEYFSSRAETWERLAYIKARPVCDRGCPLPFPDVLRGGGLNSAEIDGLLHIRLRKEAELGREKSTGSRDFKIGRGGLLDTQFFIQMLQLKHDVYEPNTLDAIPALADAGLLSPLEKETLREIVSFFYALESAADLTSPPGESEPRLSMDSFHTENIARLLGYDSPGSLLDRFESLAERNRAFLARLGKL